MVTTNGGGSTVIWNVPVAELVSSVGSDASTVSVPVCTAVGVPNTRPATASNARPDGSDASRTVQVHARRPSLQVSVCAYGWFSTAFGSADGVITIGIAPGGIRSSPDNATADCALMISMLAPTSLPSVPALIRPLDAAR